MSPHTWAWPKVHPFLGEPAMSDHLSIANNFGDVDVQGKIPTGFQHIKGKRLQPVCRTLDIPYANALVGWAGTKKYPKPEMDGVVVPHESAPRLIQAISEREARSEKRRQRETKKQESLWGQRRDEQLQAFIQKFPNASEETIAAYAHSLRPVCGTLSDAPLNCLTDEEIADLHLVRGHQSGVLLDNEGITVIPLYVASLPKDESSETPEQVHRRAIELGFSSHKALWAANKLVKMVELPPKREVYDLKDKLLQHWKDHLVDGRIAREESKTCWDCGGSGENSYGEDCDRCFGTGIYSCNTLYESRYQFSGDERIYCYHGYTKPEKLSDEPGADKRSYGYRFSPDERKAILFGLRDLIRIMKHELVLLEEIAERRKREALVTKWKARGLPELGPNKPEAKIRQCLTLIDQLTDG